MTVPLLLVLVLVLKPSLLLPSFPRILSHFYVRRMDDGQTFEIELPLDVESRLPKPRLRCSLFFIYSCSLEFFQESNEYGGGVK